MIGDQSTFTMPRRVETRWASPENRTAAKGQGAMAGGGRKGGPYCGIAPGERLMLAEEPSGVSGVVRRIWVTLDDRSPQMLRSLRIDCYWDGADRPAVSAPLGDFFGVGLGRTAAFQSAPFSSPEGRSFNCYVPMPFRSGMRIAVTNEGERALGKFFYDVDYTVGDRHADDVLYFHAHYRRERLTTLRRDYELLPRVSGKGRFLGVNVGVIVDTERYLTAWWGEGECKIYVDGDRDYPTLCSTGTEDYIGTGWELGRYDHLYQGCPVADKERMQFCFYRYHVVDPVYFYRDIRVAMQQIGCWDPKTRTAFHEAGFELYKAGPGWQRIDFGAADTPEWGNFERSDDWSSCAYFYLDAPASELPQLDSVAARTAGLERQGMNGASAGRTRT